MPLLVLGLWRMPEAARGALPSVSGDAPLPPPLPCPFGASNARAELAMRWRALPSGGLTAVLCMLPCCRESKRRPAAGPGAPLMLPSCCREGSVLCMLLWPVSECRKVAGGAVLLMDLRMALLV